MAHEKFISAMLLGAIGDSIVRQTRAIQGLEGSTDLVKPKDREKHAACLAHCQSRLAHLRSLQKQDTITIQNLSK